VVIITLITGTVESGLRNVHYGDRDSLGVFQQRAGWGSAADRLNVARSANLFLNGPYGLFKLNGHKKVLGAYPNWKEGDDGQLGWLAQHVQISAFPDRYAYWVDEAIVTYDRLVGKIAQVVDAPTLDCTQEGDLTGPVDGDAKWFNPLGNAKYYNWHNYGPRYTPWVEFHNGDDLAVPRGTPVHAAAAGTVVAAEWHSGWGNVVVINHGKYFTLYGHLSGIPSGICAHVSISCVKPTTVSGNEVIGLSGNTGLSIGGNGGYHLHLSVCDSYEHCINGGKKIGTFNPEPFMLQRGVKL
jgi:murein DD-endopeptidase MepM/ murein hydrolase activator NlpD